MNYKQIKSQGRWEGWLMTTRGLLLHWLGAVVTLTICSPSSVMAHNVDFHSSSSGSLYCWSLAGTGNEVIMAIRITNTSSDNLAVKLHAGTVFSRLSSSVQRMWVALLDGGRITLPSERFHREDQERVLGLLEERVAVNAGMPVSAHESIHGDPSRHQDAPRIITRWIIWCFGVFPSVIFAYGVKRLRWARHSVFRRMALITGLALASHVSIFVFIFRCGYTPGFFFWSMFFVASLFALLAFISSIRRVAQNPSDHAAHQKGEHGNGSAFLQVNEAEMALISAIQSNRPNEVRAVVMAGASVDTHWPSGETPLHKAAHQGQVAIVKVLLECGANPNLPTNRGHLPLHDALANVNTPVEQRVEMARLLVARGADPNALDWGRPALHFSLDSPKLVETMLALGADVNIASEYHELAAPRKGQHFEYQENALRWYCKLIVPAPAANHECVIKTLLAAGADPLQPNSEGYTAWDFVNNFLMKGPVNAQVPGSLGAIFRKRRERYIQSRIKEFEKLADLFRPIVESAKYDLFVSYAEGSGWGEFFRGRLEKTGKRIWYSELLKRTLPHYEEVMRAHINHAPAAVVFLSPDHFMADNRLKKERGRELQALLDRFSSRPEKLLLLSTGETVLQIINQHPELKGFEVFQLNETSMNDLWQRINCLSPLPPSCQQNIFYDLLNIKDHVYDCFISYRSVSVNTVRFLAEQLVARGVKPWFAEWEILVSGRRGFQESINQGLATSRTALCCTNSGYAASEYCRIEAMQVLDVPGKEHRNILELRMPAEANAISNALLSHGSKSVVVAESDLQDTWRQCCEFLGVKSDDLPERESGGQTVLLEMDDRPFTINISSEWSVMNFDMQRGLGNVAIAGFTRKIGSICLECVLNAGPWAISLLEDCQSDDRAMFEAITATLRGWNRAGKVFYPKGVHVVHVPALHTATQRVGHPAFTYLDPDRDDYGGREVPIEKCVWHRKYSIRVTPPHMPSEMEFCFDFDMRGVAHDDFATFCRYAYMMDDLVRGLKFGGAN